MKNFSTIINEDTITIPQFNHPDLQNPRDPEGKFWMAIAAANETSDKAPKGSYLKALKISKDLYNALIALENDKDIEKARDLTNEISKLIEKASDDTIEEMATSDTKALRTYLFIVANIDRAFKSKNWFKSAHVDVKAGYVPFRGASKDPKIKYRLIYTLANPVSEQVAKDITKTIPGLSPLHKDYIASIEWKKDRSAFMVTFTNSPGYKR